jgi:hypothetical protein
MLSLGILLYNLIVGTRSAPQVRVVTHEDCLDRSVCGNAFSSITMEVKATSLPSLTLLLEII